MLGRRSLFGMIAAGTAVAAGRVLPGQAGVQATGPLMAINALLPPDDVPALVKRGESVLPTAGHQIRLAIRETVRGMMAGGEFDRQMGARYGARPQGTGVGAGAAMTRVVFDLPTPGFWPTRTNPRSGRAALVPFEHPSDFRGSPRLPACRIGEAIGFPKAGHGG